MRLLFVAAGLAVSCELERVLGGGVDDPLHARRGIFSYQCFFNLCENGI